MAAIYIPNVLRNNFYTLLEYSRIW